MMDKHLMDLISEWKVKEETVFSEKMVLDSREIYPLNQITIFYKKNGEIVSSAIKPVAWFIKEKDDHYAILFDEDKEDLFWEKKSEYMALINYNNL